MDDLISRQAALVAIRNLYPDMPRVNVFGSLNRWREKNEQYIECEEAIKKLPSVKRKKGKWEMKWQPFFHIEVPMCSACETFAAYKTDVCPHCGADMREEKTDVGSEV